MATPKKSAKKPAPAKKAAPAKKPAPKKPVAKKPEPKKAPARKATPKPVAKKPEPKKPEVKKPEPKKVEAPKPEVKKPEQRREPSLFRRSQPKGQDGELEEKGIDRTRLGQLQAKIFRPYAFPADKRQNLAHIVSEISTSVAKPKFVKQQVLDELKKLEKAIKTTTQDQKLREAMLNDVDAFGAVVTNFKPGPRSSKG